MYKTLTSRYILSNNIFNFLEKENLKNNNNNNNNNNNKSKTKQNKKKHDNIDEAIVFLTDKIKFMLSNVLFSFDQ